MGGLPCQAKIILNGRIEAELHSLISESEITGCMLAAKGYYETPVLKEILDFEKGMLEVLRTIKKEFKALNDRYSQEVDSE